jgi:DNA-binding transcriptional ArsR family regulator
VILRTQYMKAQKPRLTEEMVEMVAQRFRLLGEPMRLRLLQELEAGEHTVTDLVEALEGNQSNISRHLNALFDGGLVDRRRDGNSIYYSIADPVVPKICQLVCSSMMEHIEHQLRVMAPSRTTH